LQAWRFFTRPSWPPLRMTRRNWAFDIVFAVSLCLIAIVTSLGSSREASFYQADWRGWVAPSEVAPPVPVAPVAPTPGDQAPEAAEPSEPVDPMQVDPFQAYTPTSTGEQVGWSLLMLLISVPMLFRRRYPLAMLAVTLALAPLTVGDHASLRLSFLVCVVVGYSAAVYSPFRFPALGGLVVGAVLYMQLQGNLNDPGAGPAVPTVSRDSISFWVLVPIGVAAEGLRRWKLRMSAERDKAAALEIERAALVHRANEAASLERARIARELHDVVTHNVSVMVIQAGAARKVLSKQPEQAEQALLAVEESGRSALTELRHVMGLLTIERAGEELAPQPGLAHLDTLIEQVRGTGSEVALTVEGTPARLPEGVDLAAYRVVQEGLTNMVKHAMGAAAVVRVSYGADMVEVEVADTGGVASGVEFGVGRGLLGLSERVEMYGGTVEAGPRITGGFRVLARIPLASVTL
jgi:signal transduction histidine kinase